MTNSRPAHDSGGLASLGFHNVATVVADMDKSIAWYCDVLGFALDARMDIAEGEVAILSGAGTHLELLCGSAMDEPAIRLEELFAEPPRHILPIGNKALVFDVADLAVASKELEDRSVSIVWREKELAPGWVATAIRDLDGNLINIFQR